MKKKVWFKANLDKYLLYNNLSQALIPYSTPESIHYKNKYKWQILIKYIQIHSLILDHLKISLIKQHRKKLRYKYT